MQKFRKKPVVIEATQLINNEFRSLDDIPFSDCKNWKTGKDEQFWGEFYSKIVIF